MEVVLVIASVLLLASVATAVALDRGPFAAPPRRPGPAGPAFPGRPSPRPALGRPAEAGRAEDGRAEDGPAEDGRAEDGPAAARPASSSPPSRPESRPEAHASAGLPPMVDAGRWSGRDASVRACNDLQAQLRAGRLSGAAYRKAMADVAASHDRRHPLPLPPESAG